MRRSVASGLAAQLASAGSLFLGGLMLARVLGPAARGEATLAVVIQVLAVNLLSLGVGTALIRELSRGAVPREAVGVANVTSIALSALAVPCLVLVGPALSRALGISDPVLLSLAALTLPLVLHSQFMLSVIVGLDRVALRNGAVAGQAVAYVVGVGACLAAGWGPGSALLAQAAAALVPEAIVTAVLGRALLGICLRPGTIRRYVWFGLRGHLGTLAQLVNYRFDSLVIALFWGPAPVGVYAVATSVAEGAAYVANAASLAIFPRVAAARSMADVPFFTRTTLMAAGMSAVAVAAVAPFAVPLVFGDPFAAAIGPLAVLLPGVVALAITKVLSVAFAGASRPEYVSLATGVGLLATLVFDFALIPFAGATGAAFASTVAYVLTAAASAWLFRRLTGVRLRELVQPRPADLLRLRRPTGLAPDRGPA